MSLDCVEKTYLWSFWDGVSLSLQRPFKLAPLKKKKERIAPPSDPSAAEFSCSGCCPDLIESAECDHKRDEHIRAQEKKINRGKLGRC